MSIYTDGSKQDEKVACAVISPNFTDSIRLPDNSSIFTAEAKAIDIAMYYIRDQPEKQFIIYSDSLSVLRSLKNLDHRNPLIQQIFRKYNYLSAFKEIVFCWLPSHTNIRGNELADLEAKSALSLSITNLKIPHSEAPFHPGGRNRWLLCACSRWVRPPLYNAAVRYTVPSNI